jgi:glycerol-3-phosphate dehydrogenase
LGQDHGGGLYDRELEYLIAHEWARTADDVLWRRSHLGLRMDAAQRGALTATLQARVSMP